MTLAKLLRRAAQLLEEHGWGQRAYVSSHPAREGCLCLVGAVSCAYAGPEALQGPVRTPKGFVDPLPVQARALLREYTQGISLTNWNDAQGRTKDEVLDALRWAIKQAEERGT